VNQRLTLVVAAARDLPAVSVDWGRFPDRVGTGERDMRQVRVYDRGGGAHVGIRVTVNGQEMTGSTTYLDGETSVPVAVFGAPGEDVLTYAIRVAFPELPLETVVETRTVRVE